MLGDAARAFLDGAAQDVAIECARHPAPVDSAMFVEAGVFADEEGLDEMGRHFLERHLQAVGAGESAVDFAVDVEDGVALRHRAEAF